MISRIVYNGCLALISVLICVGVAETLTRGFYHFVPNYDFEMWKYGSELKQPLPDENLPFHLIPDKSGTYYGVEIRTNSLGFRDEERPLSKPRGKKRVLVLGDSFALGWGVSADNVFSKKLEQLLNAVSPGYEVINMGIGNYNSSMEVELLKRKGLSLDPDMIIMLYFANDMEPTPKIDSLSYALFKHLYLPGFFAMRLNQLLTEKSGGDVLMAYYRKLYSPDSPSLAMNSQAIRELAGICTNRKIEALIVNIPELRKLDPYPFSFATTHIRELARETGLPFHDLLPVFQKHGGISLWVSPEDPHMNALANSLAAESVFEIMTKARSVE